MRSLAARRLPPEALVLVAASLVAALSALGPWASGIYATHPPMGSETTTGRTVHGLGSGGVLIAAPAALAALLFAAPLSLRLRYAGALVLLAAAALGCASVLLNGGVALGFHLEIFSEWRDVTLGWGIVTATAAVGFALGVALVGLLGTLRAGAPARNPS